MFYPGFELPIQKQTRHTFRDDACSTGVDHGGEWPLKIVACKHAVVSQAWSVVDNISGGRIEIGRVEAVLPRKEQSRAESYTPGERIRAVIKGVNRSAKGPQIVLSRTDPALLIKLFEQEVPEIYDGLVEIRAVAREATRMATNTSGTR